MLKHYIYLLLRKKHFEYLWEVMNMYEARKIKLCKKYGIYKFKDKKYIQNKLDDYNSEIRSLMQGYKNGLTIFNLDTYLMKYVCNQIIVTKKSVALYRKYVELLFGCYIPDVIMDIIMSFINTDKFAIALELRKLNNIDFTINGKRGNDDDVVAKYNCCYYGRQDDKCYYVVPDYGNFAENVLTWVSSIVDIRQVQYN